MWKHTIGVVMVYIMLHMLQDEMDLGSNTIYLDAMEERVRYQEDTIKQFGDIISYYQDWHEYTTKNNQVEVAQLFLPQTSKS